MPFKQRLKIFAVGFLAGCALVMVILKNRGAGERERSVPVTAEARRDSAVPGLREAYSQRGIPLESRFIVEEATYPGTRRGERLRRFVLEGAFSGQKLLVEEWIDGGDGRAQRVTAWAVMAPDEVKVHLTAGTEPHEITATLGEMGLRLRRRSRDGDALIIGLAHSGLDAVPAALESLGDGLPWVARAGPNYLDKWDSRPIPAE